MSGIDADEFNAFERRGWAENSPDAYDAVFGPVTRRCVDDLLDAAGVVVGTHVLDVATGPGYVAGRALARGASAVGVDRSSQMLAMARRSHPDIEFREADAEDLRLPDASFEAAVANFCLLHVGRPERVAAELERVLVPGGRAALTVWGPPDRARLFGLVPEALRRAGASTPAGIPEGPDFFRFSSDSEFSRLLAAAGFEQISVRTIEFSHVVADASHLWHGMLHGSVRTRALLALQQPEARARIHAEFVGLLEALKFAIPVSIKLASGRKPSAA